MNWAEMDPRERDALVAEKVMGETRPTVYVPDSVLASSAEIKSWYGNWIGTTSEDDSGDVPMWAPKPFTTDISAAWEVIKKIPTDGEHWVDLVSDWHGNFSSALHRRGDGIIYRSIWSTAPEAICLAALRAKGVDV